MKTRILLTLFLLSIGGGLSNLLYSQNTLNQEQKDRLEAIRRKQEKQRLVNGVNEDQRNAAAAMSQVPIDAFGRAEGEMTAVFALNDAGLKALNRKWTAKQDFVGDVDWDLYLKWLEQNKDKSLFDNNWNVMYDAVTNRINENNRRLSPYGVAQQEVQSLESTLRIYARSYYKHNYVDNFSENDRWKHLALQLQKNDFNAKKFAADTQASAKQNYDAFQTGFKIVLDATNNAKRSLDHAMNFALPSEEKSKRDEELIAKNNRYRGIADHMDKICPNCAQNRSSNTSNTSTPQ